MSLRVITAYAASLAFFAVILAISLNVLWVVFNHFLPRIVSISRWMQTYPDVLIALFACFCVVCVWRFLFPKET